MPTPEICIIFNPAAGRRRAQRQLESLRQTFGSDADFQPTQFAGHAEELARTAAADGFAVVAAMGGDGTVHEVANGILHASRSGVSLAVIPAGSANDYAHSLKLDERWWQSQNGPPQDRLVDVGAVRSPNGRARYFVNGLGLGFNGAVTLESRRIRYLRGVPLYGLALLRALVRHYTAPVMSITFDEKQYDLPTLALTVALGRREGNFVLAPEAILDDGYFDYLHAASLSRWELLRNVPGMVTGHLPEDHPKIRRGRCRRVAVSSQTPLLVHVDGEFFCQPADQIHSLEVEILPLALRVYGKWTD